MKICACPFSSCHPSLAYSRMSLSLFLFRFCKLRSLSLSNNGLSEVPLALCDISSLTELNLSGNRLSFLSAEVGTMHK